MFMWLMSPLLAIFGTTVDEDDGFGWWGIALFILALVALIIGLVWTLGKANFFSIWFAAFGAFWADVFKTVRGIVGMK